MKNIVQGWNNLQRREKGATRLVDACVELNRTEFIHLALLMNAIVHAEKLGGEENIRKELGSFLHSPVCLSVCQTMFTSFAKIGIRTRATGENKERESSLLTIRFSFLWVGNKRRASTHAHTRRTTTDVGDTSVFFLFQLFSSHYFLSIRISASPLISNWVSLASFDTHTPERTKERTKMHRFMSLTCFFFLFLSA